MNNGFIKINRSILKWTHYKKNNTKIVFLHLLLTANWEDKEVNGMLIKRGQVLTTVKRLSEELQQTTQQIRTALKNLKSTNEITINTTRRCSIITIVAWDKYQTSNNYNNNKKNENQQTNQQINQQTNTKENKEIKNNNIYIRAREEDFNLVNCYQELCTNLKPILPTSNYQSEIIQLIESLKKGELTEDQVKEAFKKANNSNFICGGGKDKWIGHFGWLCRPINIQRILNGEFDNEPINRTNVKKNRKKSGIQEHGYAYYEDIIKQKLKGG